MPLEQISSGSPPLLWSNVNDAFTKINANFETLAASIGGGGSLIDFEQFDNNVIPAASNAIRLGDITKPWKRLHVDSYRDNLTDTMNGLWLGSAHIKGIDTSIDLPIGSTVNGSLIIDPEKTFFRRVSVDDFNVIEANDFSDTLNLAAGTAMQLVVDSSAEKITINNAGVTSLIGGTAISVSSSTGNITVTNTGVTSLTNSTSLPGGLTSGSGISVSAATGGVLITNTGVLQVQQGFGITVSTDTSTGIATISNSAPAQVTFRNFVINGDALNAIVADSTSDTFNLNTGYGLITTKDPATDTLNISLNQRIDIIGSVFGDDSSVLVDGVNNYIYGNVSATTLRTSETKIALGSGAGATSQTTGAIAIGQQAGEASQSMAIAIGSGAGQASQGFMAVAVGHGSGLGGQGANGVAIGASAGELNQGSSGIAIGYYAGKTTQESGAVAIGYTTGQVTQRTGAVAIGWSAGQTNQGANAIAIGYRAGFTNQNASSIVLNASGAALEAAAAGLYINPIRSSGNGRPLMYDTATSELFSSNVLEFIGSTISTSDSSAVQFDGPVNFQTSIIVDGNITLKDNLILEKRLAIAELEGVNQELNIYSNWAKDTGISIYSATGTESVTLTSNRVVGVVTGVGPTQKEWVFDTNGQIQFPDSRYQTGAAISIAELKVLVAAAGSYAAFQSAIAALA